jgi:chromosome segregation ATPase
MKELIERLRNDCYQEDEVRAHAKEAAAALERMERESQPAALEASTTDSVHQINMRRATNRFEQLMIENKNLRRNLTFWRDSYSLLSRTAHAAERGIERADDEFIRMSGDIERLTAERDSLKEGLDGWHARYLDMETQCDALAKNAERVRVYKQRCLEAIAERDALRADAELKYTAWQSPHNDDLWFENPADCEIIDNFHPPVHVGFEYELTAGSYTTQRYRVVKIADAESDDVLVELIAGEKT